MNNNSTKASKYYIALTGAGLAVLSWLAGSAVRSFIFHHGAFADYLMPHDNDELWMRLTIAGMFIIFGMIAQATVNTLRKTQGQLKDTRRELEYTVALRTSELKAVNRELRQVNSIYETINAFNSIRATSLEEPDLFINTCRIIIEIGGYSFAWIGYAGQDEDKTVFPIASAGEENGYLQSVKITWADNEYGRGPTGMAIRSGEPHVARDIKTAADYALWRTEAMKRGYASSIALPLLINKQIIGVLNIYSSEPDAFEAEEVKLLTRLVRELEYSILAVRSHIERNFAEEALKQSEEMLSIKDAALSSSISGFALADLSGHLTYVNHAFLNYWGYDDEREVLGKPVTECWQDREKIKDVMDTLSIKGNWSGELAARTKDGSSKDIQLSANIVKDREGAPICMFASFIDITEKKRLGEQLMQSQKMESVGQLAGGIAHDFNNLLMAIKGDIYLLNLKTESDNILKKYLADISRSVEKAANLTGGLLAFSRKQIIRPETVSVNKIVESMQGIMRRLLPEDIEFRVEYIGRDVTIMADSGQIEQVLINLINNAKDAMPQGGMLTISTKTKELDDDFIKHHGYGKQGLYALITVADTGIGMDEKTREKIFEPFFTTKEVGKGTGLGLAVVYGIIKQHGGYITCYSELGTGTAFEMYFPITENAKKAAEEKKEEVTSRGIETILLAEDHAEVRNSLSIILAENGYKIIEAFDGEDALNKFLEHKDAIDIVVMDVIMPRKNGKEVYDEIIRTKAGIKVLFISGYDNSIINKKGIIDASMNFISKPVKPSKLLKKIRDIIDTAQP